MVVDCARDQLVYVQASIMVMDVCCCCRGSGTYLARVDVADDDQVDVNLLLLTRMRVSR